MQRVKVFSHIKRATVNSRDHVTAERKGKRVFNWFFVYVDVLESLRHPLSTPTPTNALANLSTSISTINP